MLPLRLIVCLTAWLLAFAAPVLAQGLPQTTSAAPAPILRANSNLVLVDVVVTDKSGAGNPVHGLDKSRFHIFEDGREQTITSFDEHRPGNFSESVESAAAGSSKQAPLPPHTFTNVPEYPPAPAVNVLLLDGLNTPLINQMDVRRQMLEFMGKITPGTQLAVFTLASRLRLVQGFTTNAAQLTQALKGGKANPQSSSLLDSPTQPGAAQGLDSAIADLATMGADPNAVSSMQQFQADLTAFQTDQRVVLTLEAMQQLARYLSAIPGRKNLIWFSGSFPIALDPDDSLQSPFQAMRNYSEQIEQTSEMLSAARVAVYPVDARGLMSLPSFDASYTASSNLVGGGASRRRGGGMTNPSNRPNPAKDDQNFMKQQMQEHATMEQIAEQTGGHAYLNTNGLKEAVASAVDDGSSYYTVGYIPAAKEFNGNYRKLQIKLTNADYQLAYRHGYFADDPEKPSAHNPGQTSLIVATTLHGAPPSTQILFKAQVLPADDPLLKGSKLPEGAAGELTASLKGPIHRYIVDLRVDAHGVAFEAQPDGSHRAKVEYTLVAYNTEGQRTNYFDVGLQLNPKPDQFSRITANGVPVRLAIDLPEGQGSLRVAVHDLNAGRAGSLELPLTVPAK